MVLASRPENWFSVRDAVEPLVNSSLTAINDGSGELKGTDIIPYFLSGTRFRDRTEMIS